MSSDEQTSSSQARPQAGSPDRRERRFFSIRRARAHAAGLGMGVRDHYWGKGIGKALTQEILNAAGNWFRIKRLELIVFTDNKRAIRLYEKFGFEMEGIRSAFAFRAGQYADALAIARVAIISPLKTFKAVTGHGGLYEARLFMRQDRQSWTLAI